MPKIFGGARVLLDKNVGKNHEKGLRKARRYPAVGKKQMARAAKRKEQKI